jgi:hypothetical protein
MCDVKDSITVDGVTYVRQDLTTQDADGFSIVRADSGLFFAQVESRTDRECVLKNARQLHYWKTKGLNYLDIANYGVLEGSKITSEVPSLTIMDVRSVTPCSKTAVKSIQGVKAWKP